MKKEIPAPIIALMADYLIEFETHTGLDNLFLHADAPGDPPQGNKSQKIQLWLKRINKESNDPLKHLGKIIEQWMEFTVSDQSDSTYLRSETDRKIIESKLKLESKFTAYGLTYMKGGTVLSSGASAPSLMLADIIRTRDMPAIEAEFTRAMSRLHNEPREAVSVACNLLESIFKIYISDEGLCMPAKQDLQSVWKIVRKDLGIDPGLVQDDDLKRILSGIYSVVDGIGAFRTHASSAHGEGRKIYNLKPRHARLAVNAAHTLGLFVLETWNEKKASRDS